MPVTFRPIPSPGRRSSRRFPGVDIALISAYFLGGPLWLAMSHLWWLDLLNSSSLSWRPVLIYGVVAPLTGYLLLRRSRRARFTAYVFLTMDILRSILRASPISLAIDVGVLLYLQTPWMRAIYPSLKWAEIVARLRGRARAIGTPLHLRGAAQAPAPSGGHRPSLISWNLTSACNLRCPHCYLEAGRPQEEELGTQECLRLVDEMAALGTEMLILTGGEPLLRPDIFDLARHASRRGLMVVLGTNGVLLGQEMARQLAASGIKGVGISLDSLRPEEHDRFRGFRGAWERAVAALEACRQQGLEVVVQTTVMDWNYGEIPALMDFAHLRGARAFNLYYLVCTGRGEKLTDITPQQYEESLARLVELQDSYPGMMVRAKCAPHVRRIARQRGSALIGSAGCLAGTSYLRIAPQGEVTPCPYLPLAVGNVREAGLRALWEGAPLFQELRQARLRGRCGVCDYGEVCIGCRARAWAMTGDLLGEDPWCTHQPGTDRASSPAPVEWSPQALERLERIPGFIRSKVKVAIEGYAREKGCPVVTPELMAEVRRNMGSPSPRPEARR